MKKTILAMGMLCATMLAQGQTYFGKHEHPMNRMTTNLKIIEYWDNMDADRRKVYAAAEKILTSHQHAGYAELNSNREFQELCKSLDMELFGSPMLGQVSPRSMSIWLRTVKPAQITVVTTNSTTGEQRHHGPFFTKEIHDNTATYKLDGLQTNSSYTYKLILNNEKELSANNFSFKTTEEASVKQNMTIAFGSCPHRWGLANEKLWQQIKSEEPLAMLLLGDIAVQDRMDQYGHHKADYLLRDFQSPWSNFVPQIPVYASWDDHDYFGNDLAGIPEGHDAVDKEGVWEVFRNSWNNPYYGFGEENKGVFTDTQIGPVDVIMTDNRYFREGKPGSFLGNEQMEWLKKRLLESQSPFKIVSCGSMWSDYLSKGKDSWGVNDPDGREELFQFIEDNNIGGVLFISGDRHGAHGFEIRRPSGYKFYEFEAASLGARVGPETKEKDLDKELYGIMGEFAFGTFTFDTTVEDPEVTFQLIHEDGHSIYSRTFTLSELSPKPVHSQR